MNQSPAPVRRANIESATLMMIFNHADHDGRGVPSAERLAIHIAITKSLAVTRPC